MTTALLIENSANQDFLFSNYLQQCQVISQCYSVDSLGAAQHLLFCEEHLDVDVVLLDLSIASGCGIDMLRNMALIDARLPIVALTSDERSGLECIKYGAQDYLLKTEKDEQVVVRAIRYAIERRKEEARYFQLAKNDVMTGLVNRPYFETMLAKSIQRTQNVGGGRCGKLALIFIDVDHFKRVNETLGHGYGDQLLVAVGSRLTAVLSAADTLARMGGDEFAIVVEALDNVGEITALAEKIKSSLATPFWIGNSEAFVSASIGIATYPQDGKNATILMQNADAAMYQAKQEGRNQYQFFQPERHRRNLIQLQLEDDLQHAIENAEFSLHYQPKFDLHRHELVGVEALLRWSHKEQGNISPSEFIPLAERCGQILGIGTWVIEQVCKQLVSWRQRDIPIHTVAVNISAVELNDPTIVDRILSILARYQIPPSAIEIELTESAVMRDIHVSQGVLQALKDYGFSIAIDDFGTGYSSLAYLKKFPLDSLKIDRSFIENIVVDDDDLAITQAIIALGHSLKLKIVAEGVETEDQYFTLQALGCDEIQGFFFSHPLAVEDLEPLLFTM